MSNNTIYTFLSEKTEREVQGVCYIPYTHTYIAFRIITITHQNGTFSTKHKPTLTHHNHPTSLVSLRVQPSCCMLWVSV